MSTVGRKLTKTFNTVGRKMHHGGRVGQKLVGDALGQTRRLSKMVDVGARKVGNTADRINRGIGDVQPYLSGIPVAQQLATIGRDGAKATQLASQGVRKGAGMIERESKLGEKALAEVSQFI